MSKEELVSGCSRPRNREIMRIFKDVDLVEQLGTGMNKMMKAYTPDIFTVSPNFLHTVFSYKSLEPENVPNVPNDGISERQKLILNLLKNSGQVAEVGEQRMENEIILYTDQNRSINYFPK